MNKRLRFRERRNAVETVQPPAPLAMRLALAHYVDRCVEDGTLASYAVAANRLGISRARMTQVMDLLSLNAVGKEQILLGHS